MYDLTPFTASLYIQHVGSPATLAILINVKLIKLRLLGISVE